MQIYFLDVGQGDATLLCFENHSILIDTGSEDTQNDLSYRLNQLGISQIDLLVITHGDEDHIGGADKICQDFTVNKIWYNDLQENDSVRAFLDTNFPYSNAFIGEKYSISSNNQELIISVLYPIAQDETNSNNSSIILKVIFGEISLLLMGDAEEVEENNLLRNYNNEELQANLLKIAHHGSSTSTSSEFLSAVNPDFAVIFCEKNNPYGHPHGEVLNLLAEQEIQVYRTDLDGEIHFSTDGNTLNYIEN